MINLFQTFEVWVTPNRSCYRYGFTLCWWFVKNQLSSPTMGETIHVTPSKPECSRVIVHIHIVRPSRCLWRKVLSPKTSNWSALRQILLASYPDVIISEMMRSGMEAESILTKGRPVSWRRVSHSQVSFACALMSVMYIDVTHRDEQDSQQSTNKRHLQVESWIPRRAMLLPQSSILKHTKKRQIKMLSKTVGISRARLSVFGKLYLFGVSLSTQFSKGKLVCNEAPTKHSLSNYGKFSNTFILHAIQFLGNDD